MGLRHEVNVIIKVILELREVPDITGIGPIAELAGPGQADDGFNMC